MYSISGSIAQRPVSNTHGLVSITFCIPGIVIINDLNQTHTIHILITAGTQHFVISNEEPWALTLNATLMPEIFKEAGYSTNLVGKWHLGFSRPEYTPTRRGFDYHFGYWGAYIDYFQRRSKMPVANYSLGYDFRRNMELECRDRGVYVTDLLTAEAERLIKDHADKEQPLFLMLSHLAAHTANEDDPLQAPEEEIQKFSYIKDPNRRKYAGNYTLIIKCLSQT